MLSDNEHFGFLGQLIKQVNTIVSEEYQAGNEYIINSFFVAVVVMIIAFFFLDENWIGKVDDHD